MYNKNNHAILIVAAGSGERFGSTVPKQYLPLLGRTLLRRSIDAFSAAGFNNIHVVISQGHETLYADNIAGLEMPAAIMGGASRQESARLGLEALAKLAPPPEYVWIHDAARPCVSSALIERVAAALQKSDAVVPGLPMTDTLRRQSADGTKTESRDNLFTIQTPQAFRFETIFNLHKQHADKTLTDDAALCEIAGPAITIVAGDKGNFKITHADDLPLMEQALANSCSDIRTGKGYDVHRLIPPPDDVRKLLICGIAVPHSHVLEGHSDADVGLHAITDALLATICDGDIGMHFSPKDARWKGADSAKFLRHAADLVAAQGGIITHVDVTVICEAPKVGPHRDAMRQRVGEILNLPVSRVSVKATTTEGLGFTGRREGIAAEAMATVRLPFAATAAAGQDDIRKWGT